MFCSFAGNLRTAKTEQNTEIAEHMRNNDETA